jgi:hypothetical protein
MRGMETERQPIGVPGGFPVGAVEKVTETAEHGQLAAEIFNGM